MVDLLESVRSHCNDVPPALVDMHFRRLPAAYFERYSAADIARHLHLLAGLSGPHPIDVEVRPLASHAFEVLTVGRDYSGTVACITAALAADGFDLEDVQVASYMESEAGRDAEPHFFVVVLRVSGNLKGRAVADVTGDLRERLRAAFLYLAQGNLLEAQATAADTRISRGDRTHPTPRPPASETTVAEYEGLVLGNDFRLQRKLATGGMSDVYLATQISLNRTVAVKLIRHEGEADDDLLARFTQEALVLGQFNCPYIVQVLAAGTMPGRSGGTLGWMAMEYMAGGDLARWLRRKGTPPVELGTRWFHQALEGLHYAHRHSILHRDLKPHNLLLTIEGNVKVTDFGLLKQVQQPAAGLTPRSAILGTPHYMSPEQALGEPLDERSDIFSLGTTFFHIFSGKVPFDKNSHPAILVQIAQEDAPRLTDLSPEAPSPLAVILARMMARKKEERYQDVGVVLEDLASYERRGLLKSHDPGTYVPSPGEWSGPAETQAYLPRPEGADDVVI
ncbi:MAG TPA: protein kinase [Gemmataceae bacterium]|nr:protein kinase [Gemmataceae bacterium]